MGAGSEGYPTARSMPAPYVVRRRITATVAAGAPQLVNLRTEEWSGRSPRLKDDAPGYADQVAARARAVLVFVSIRVEEGLVRFLEQDVNSEYVNTATPTALLEIDWRVEDGAFRFWYHTQNAEAVFEIEIWFDVPAIPETFV